MPLRVRNAEVSANDPIFMRKGRFLCLASKDREETCTNDFDNSACADTTFWPSEDCAYGRSRFGRRCSVLSCYGNQRKQLKVWKKVFLHMFHRIMLNSYLLYKGNTSDQPVLTRLQYIQQVVESLSGLVSQQSIVQTSNTQHTMQLQILLQLSRLTDGENYETRYSDENNWTVLEDMLVSFKGLANNLPDSYHTLMEENKNLIAKQAVLVACREDDFEAAAEVYNRISDQITDKSVTENLKAVLALKSKDHKYVTSKSNSYSVFVSDCVAVISEFNKEFDVPFLTKILNGLRRREKKRPSTTNTKNPSVLKALSKRMTNDKKCLPLNQEDETEMSGALETIRNREVDILLDDVSPPPKKIKEDDRSNVKPPFKVPHQPRKASSPVSSTKGREDLDLNPLRSPKGIRQFSYRKNIMRADRHADNQSSNARSKEADREDSESDEEGPLKKRVHKNQNGSLFSPLRQPSSLLRPSSPTESTFSSRKTAWGHKETEDFYQAVQEFGVGKWADIKQALGTFRTNVNLKDRWRTINKTGEIKELEKKFGPV